MKKSILGWFTRKAQFLLVLQLILLPFQPALAEVGNQGPDVLVIEDAEDGATAGWTLAQNLPGSSITNVDSGDPAHGRVINLQQLDASKSFNFNGGKPWDYQKYKILSWDAKFSGDVQYFVFVNTFQGVRYLAYGTKLTTGKSGNTLRFNLGSDYKDGKWHTIQRDLQSDLMSLERHNGITGISYFNVQGTGQVDNFKLSNLDLNARLGVIIGQVYDWQQKGIEGVSITVAGFPNSAISDANGIFTIPSVPAGTYTVHVASSRYSVADQEVKVYANGLFTFVNCEALEKPAVVYEDAEDGLTVGWTLAQNLPGSSITNVDSGDRARGKVIELRQLDASKSFNFNQTAGQSWDYANYKILSWDAKFNKDVQFFIFVNTTGGMRYIAYGTKLVTGRSGNSLRFQLDPQIKDGTWHTITRDLQKDLESLEPGNVIKSLSYFNVQGTGQIDNFKLKKAANEPVDPVQVVKNVSFDERTEVKPTGFVGGYQAKVGSFLISAGADDVAVSSVTIRDRSNTYCMGIYLKNVNLISGDGTKIGETLARPSQSCDPQNNYTFNFNPAIKILKNTLFQVDVFADTPEPLIVPTTPLIQVHTVNAVGIHTGTDASAYQVALALQSVYVMSHGQFMVTVDSYSTPESINYLMGTTNQDIAAFKISASSTEAVNIIKLVISSKFSSGATGTMTNIRLIDQSTGKQVGFAVAGFSDIVNGINVANGNYAHATFTGINFQIPAGQSKVLMLRVDFTTYHDGQFATTGQTFTPVILRSNYGVGHNPNTAYGADSGNGIIPTISERESKEVVPNNPGAYANLGTLYRAKLSTAWASDAPSGASERRSAQYIAKFVVSNIANSGGYSATIKYLNLKFASTISAPAGTNATRALTIYKDSLSTTPIAVTNFAIGQKPVGTTAISDANFTDVEIASGASKTFYVTFDTTDAVDPNSLTVTIPAAGVAWTDGVSDIITKMGEDLPLNSKTFTY